MALADLVRKGNARSPPRRNGLGFVSSGKTSGTCSKNDHLTHHRNGKSDFSIGTRILNCIQVRNASRALWCDVNATSSLKVTQWWGLLLAVVSALETLASIHFQLVCTRSTTQRIGPLMCQMFNKNDRLGTRRRLCAFLVTHGCAKRWPANMYGTKVPPQLDRFPEHAAHASTVDATHCTN